MSLPPLANLLAVRREDPREAEALANAFEADPRFAEVWRPAAAWVVGVAPLPGGEPDPVAVRAAGAFFAEGRDAAGADTREGADQAARLALEHPGRLAELRGDFTFLAFGQDGSATAVRSASGRVPLYRTEDGGAISTRLAWLAPYLPGEPAMDPLGLGVWMAGLPVFPDGRTPLAGVRVIPRGGFAPSGPSGAREGTYWDPRPDRLGEPTEARFREHADRLRSALLDTLSAELAPDGGNLLSLSGGIDSSTLLGLAGHTLGLPVLALSLVPAEGPTREAEARYLDAAVRHTPADPHLRIPMAPGDRPVWARDAPSPGFPVIHPVLHLLPRALAEAPVRVLFGGEFGDEIGGSKYTLPDWARAVGPSAFLKPSKLPRGGRDLARWVRTRTRRALRRFETPFPARLPEGASPGARKEYRDWLSDVSREAARDRRPLATLTLRASMDAFTAMNWEAASELGIRRVTPYFTREVLELVFDCHPAELIGPGFRRLQRAALAGDAPPDNLARDDTGSWMYGDPVPAPWEGILPPTAASAVDPAWFPRPPGPVQPFTGAVLWSIVRFGEALVTGDGGQTGQADHLDTSPSDP